MSREPIVGSGTGSGAMMGLGLDVAEEDDGDCSGDQGKGRDQRSKKGGDKKGTQQ